jgi:hypothetical protein
MKVMLVGESFGKHEQQFSHPLVWWSGRELARMLAEAHLAPPVRAKYPGELEMIAHWKYLRSNHGIAVTNVFNLHPDGDKTELFFSRDGDKSLPGMRIKSSILYVRPDYRSHVDKLYAEISELRPNLIIALGNFACWALLGASGISSIRGTVQLSERLKIKVLPTYHPAALRDWSLRPTIVADLTKAAREAEFPEIRRIKRYITCESNLTKDRVTLDEIETWFQTRADSYAIDIETGYSLFTKAELKNLPFKMKKILAELITMVSFASDSSRAVVIPFMTREDEELNYWKTEADEIRAWKIVARELNSPIPKTFQNGLFDIGHFVRNKFLVRNAIDDTMILNHALFPESLKSLGYLGSLHSNETNWKSMRASGEDIKREA